MGTTGKRIRVKKINGLWVARKDGNKKPLATGKKKDAVIAAALQDPAGLGVCIYGADGRYIRNYPDDNGCYLTTACVQHKGLPDDCRQLTVLREFRKTYVRNLPGGKEILIEYAMKAPVIIEGIKNSGKAEIEYENIFKMINRTVTMIEQGENKKALQLYFATALYLERRYMKRC